ncbi:zinc finger protein 652-B [Lucilia cuprina]|uniref:zinc finger protein 652-B n=1 Tax=Lucilia cuprina TaxID=7375 RepID=UPI001F07029E|nr:zinc finger protein 652-B [Lucilia cuprina]
MANKIYPNLQKMCRLCLKEDAATVCIFSKEKNSDKYAALSIPMRIMTCAALEVQDAEDFPTKICPDCRLQLEKSYLFRKQSQASDAKLRKHLRLIGMGKTSKVFNKKTEDDDDDELELQDSIEFIKEQEDNQKQIEKLKFDAVINEIKQQNEQDLKKIKENLRLNCREELIPEIREQLKNELRLEVENELEEGLRKEISEQYRNEAKKALRAEVMEECRQVEVKCLLDDLQTFLNNKKKTLGSDSTTKDVTDLKRPLSPTNKKDLTAKRKMIVQNSSKKEEVQIQLQEEEDLNNKSMENGIIISEQDLNTNDDECDSEGNFLIYDTDDGGIDIQKKPLVPKEEFNGNNVVASEEYEDDEYIDSNSTITYEKVNEENMDTNEESGETTTTTTSYRIEDNENGEIQFLQKSNDDDEIEVENADQGNENVMVIDFQDGMDNEYIGQFEEVKYVKAKKQLKSKSKKSPGKKAITRTTTSTTETILTKTYVNPFQRSTDTPKTFKCDDCPMVFSTKPSLERHLRTHRKVGKSGVIFQCPECQIVVSCSSALRRHMYVHCEVKPFACNICDKAFVQREILKRHMQTHTGIKPHQCPQCDRSFAQRISLTEHINRTHLDEPRIQRHACHLCPKRFNHASGLSRHLASHSGVAFQCSECDRTFGDRSSVKRHIINTHGNLKPSKVEVKTEIP